MKTIIEKDIDNICRAVDTNRFRGKSILVAGNTGHVGGYLWLVLSRLGDEIVLMGSNSKHQNILTRPVSSGRFDYIFHCAGKPAPAAREKEPASAYLLSTIGTKNLLSALKPDRDSRFVFMSSSEIYNWTDPSSPSSAYHEGKRAGEMECSLFQMKEVMSIVRPHHIYGPGLALNDSRAFMQFVKSAISGRIIELTSTGEQMRDVVYIADAVAWILNIALSAVRPPSVIGSGHMLSLYDFASLFAPTKKGLVVPEPMGRGPALKKRDWFLTPKEGVERTLRYYRENSSL